MADPSDKVSKPTPDPLESLRQLKGIVASNKATGGGGKSWIGTLIIIAVVVIGIAIGYWITWRRGRELAKLRHEKNKTAILKEKAEAEREITKNMVESIEAGKRIKEAERTLLIIEATIGAEEARYEADLRAINSIRSWRDAGVS